MKNSATNGLVRNGLYWNPRSGPIWKAVAERRLVAQTTITGHYLSIELTENTNLDFMSTLEPCSPAAEQHRFNQQQNERKRFRQESVLRYRYA